MFVLLFLSLLGNTLSLLGSILPSPKESLSFLGLLLLFLLLGFEQILFESPLSIQGSLGLKGSYLLFLFLKASDGLLLVHESIQLSSLGYSAFRVRVGQSLGP